MPAITSGKVLVSGANGYIAIWVVSNLLERGYAVRGTVRSASKGDHLKETFKSYGDKFEVVVVEDITKPGAFDEAVKGVDAIEHTASPFHLKVDDPDELIIPAVAGTRGVLQSALEHGPTVKRIVVTSSCASVLTQLTEPRVFDETSWNERSPKAVEELGKKAAPIDKYRASKTLAERAAWKFVEQNKNKIKYDLVVLNPPFVFGPPLHEVGEAASLNTSMLDLFKYGIKGLASKEVLNIGSCWVDVRDLGLAHALALEKEEAGGQRIIVSSDTYKWQEWLNEARKLSPDVPIGDPDYDPKKAVHLIKYNTSKADKLFGIKYRTKEECMRDMYADLKARGFLN